MRVRPDAPRVFIAALVHACHPSPDPAAQADPSEHTVATPSLHCPPGFAVLTTPGAQCDHGAIADGGAADQAAELCSTHSGIAYKCIAAEPLSEICGANGVARVTADAIFCNPPTNASEGNTIETPPYKIAGCESLTHRYGSWVPSRDVLDAVSRAAANAVCYNYFELDPRRYGATLTQCAEHVGTNTMRVTVEVEDGRCELQIRAASSGRRNWLWLSSLYVRGGQVGDQVDIFELTDGRVEPYATYWQCHADRDAAMQSAVPPGDEGPSPQMQKDWPSLPATLRGFFCTGKRMGDDLSKP